MRGCSLKYLISLVLSASILFLAPAQVAQNKRPSKQELSKYECSLVNYRAFQVPHNYTYKSVIVCKPRPNTRKARR